MTKTVAALLGALLFAGTLSCGSSTSPGDSPVVDVPNENDPDDRIYIQDVTGKRWDVTDAERIYGMKAEDFQFGIGPNAIRPINFPAMFKPGDPGYPTQTDQVVVVGTVINEDARAYSLAQLNSHEVVNEVIGGEDVFVGW